MSVAFFDSNVIVYFASGDPAKADVAERLLAQGGTISVQVLNEVAHVLRRKFRMEWSAVQFILTRLRRLLTVVPVTSETHDLGLSLAENHNLPVHDAMIAAAGLLAGCGVLLSEDFQDRMVFAGRMRVENPFRM